MVPNPPRTWSFLTNHAQVLLCIATNPAIRLREIGDSVGITERASHRIVSELAQAGYISRRRVGRRNHYTIEPDLPLPDPLARAHRIGDLLALLDQRREARPLSRAADGRPQSRAAQAHPQPRAAR